MNKVNHLLVSSTLDYSTDLVCCELERRGCNYLRINRDLFDKYKIMFDFDNQIMNFQIEDSQYTVCNETLQSVYFRAPVFFRYSKELSLEDQLYRGQWGAFIRNLIIFDKARWFNHPVSIYKSENKMYQLQVAKKIGMVIPQTYVGNYLPNIIEEDKDYIIKALDTPVFYDGKHEMFTYTTVLNGQQIKKSELQEAPVIIQENLCPKTDLRITVVGNHLFPAQIQINGAGVNGDWRRNSKDDLTYSRVDLPQDIEDNIHKLLIELGLNFGGVDFAFCNGKYYFIEINPTGEWGWLVRSVGFKIPEAIVDFLEGK